MTVVAVDDVYREMAQLAASFGWGRDELLGLEHAERRRWVQEATALTGSGEAASDQPGIPAGFPWGSRPW